MSMLIQEVDQSDAAGRRRSPPVNNPQAAAVIWAFYESNPDRVILKVGGFMKIRVRDLRVLFEALAGPEPS